MMGIKKRVDAWHVRCRHCSWWQSGGGGQAALERNLELHVRTEHPEAHDKAREADALLAGLEKNERAELLKGCESVLKTLPENMQTVLHCMSFEEVESVRLFAAAVREHLLKVGA
jgi:hypothetical protein